MTSKQHRLRRSTAWHARRGIRIGRKVAWKVLGFASPKAYREWRDQRIRHERRITRGRDGILLWHFSPCLPEWMRVQPCAFRSTAHWEDT